MTRLVILCLLGLCSTLQATEVKIKSEVGFSTGAVVGTESGKSLVLTCAHGVGIINWVNGHLAEVVLVDEDKDLALLKATKDEGKPLRLGFYLLPGDEIQVRGFAGTEREHRVADGDVHICLQNGDQQCNLSATTGMSGAPVLNKKGELVGLLWGVTEDETAAAVTSIGKIRRFLRRYSQHRRKGR